ncbi:MAG: serine/threonine protein kinase [Deltaproteobacteria bacterium]|nr:serine/threonine protein kinase [Deltaproteobacteria bacterium]
MTNTHINNSLEQLGNEGKRNGGPVVSPEAPFLDPLYPRHIGRYELIYPISRGGMASVFAGRLTGLAGFQKLLAIKIIHPHLSSETHFIEMFLDEARLAASIHHPHISEVIEVGEDNGLYYMVCELVAGQSLRDLQKRAEERNITISPVVAARIVSTTAIALQAAHDLVGPGGDPLNLVHRDVSPRNILLSYDGFVKLIDFGVAHAKGRISHTETGTIKGKVGYVSPEQVKCTPVDARSDIFSLGVVLYELVTGRAPFDGVADVDRLFKIVTHEFEAPHKILPDIPARLEAIILRAMALHPKDRFPTASAMSAELDAFIADTGETVDTAKLSALMTSLFSEEKETHYSRVRHTGKRNSNIAPVSPTDEMTKPMPVRPRDLAKTKELYDTHSQTLSTRLVRDKLRIPAIVALVVLGIMISVLWASTTDTNAAFVGKMPSKNVPALPKASPMAEIEISNAIATPITSGDEVIISLEVSPNDASVEFDGMPMPPGNQALQLDADEEIHQLRVFAAGYETIEMQFKADTDQNLIIHLIPTVPAVTSSRDQGTEKRSPDSSSSPKEGEFGDQESSLLEKSPYK